MVSVPKDVKPTLTFDVKGIGPVCAYDLNGDGRLDYGIDTVLRASLATPRKCTTPMSPWRWDGLAVREAQRAISESVSDEHNIILVVALGAIVLMMGVGYLASFFGEVVFFAGDPSRGNPV